VTATLGEGDAGSGHQVLDGPRHQDLRGPGQRRHPIGDLDRSAGDVLAHQVYLAGVDSGANLDPGRGGIGQDRGRAADRLPGCIKGGQQAVRAVLDQAASMSPD
jgi:hypothetical protein